MQLTVPYMTVITKNVQILSNVENNIIDITNQTSQAVKESKIDTGIVTVFVVGSTAAITTIEYEPGLLDDFQICCLEWHQKILSINITMLGMMETDTLTYAHP